MEDLRLGRRGRVGTRQAWEGVEPSRCGARQACEGAGPGRRGDP